MSLCNGQNEAVTARPIEKIGDFLASLVDRIEALERKIGEDATTTSSKDVNSPIGVAEASRLLRLSESRVYVLSKGGHLPCHRRGGRLYFFRDELTGLIRSSDSTQKVSRNKKAVAL